MQTIRKISAIQSLNYPLEDIAPPDKVLFLDIETTGFTAGHSCLYLVGCVYFEEGCWHAVQWLAEDYSQEKEVLEAFLDFSRPYGYLVHYNGNRFDIPYLLAKCEQYDFDKDRLTKLAGIDIYKRITSYKSFLKLPNLKQKTVEAFLHIGREDVYNGGQLISVYHEYVKQPCDYTQNLLLLHNFNDLEGLLKILPILAYPDILNLPLEVRSAGRNPYSTLSGEPKSELVVSLALTHPVPVRISSSFRSCYFTAQGYEAKLRVNIYAGELKYFYPNYKDYYYLPEEDTAVHKSVAAYVDRQHRENAKASTCYTKRTGLFLPQWEEIFTPVFRENYHDSLSYFELTDEIKRDSGHFRKYSEHILQYMIANA